MTWWVNWEGDMKKYFGGVDPTVKGNSDKCACGVTESCANSTLPCNCDANDLVWRSDEGDLTHKEDLPVTEFRCGETGKSNTSIFVIRCAIVPLVVEDGGSLFF